MAVISKTRRELTSGDLKLMGLPQRFWPLHDVGDNQQLGVSLKNFNECIGKTKVHKYLQRDILPNMLFKGYGFLFHGEGQSGKTSMAALLCHEVRRYDATVTFINAGQLVDAVKNKVMWGEGISLEERVRKVDFLVIDDLGDEMVNQDDAYCRKFHHHTFITYLIRSRYDHMKSTVITTPLPRKRFESLYPSSMVNVLNDNFVHFVELSKKDLMVGVDNDFSQV